MTDSKGLREWIRDHGLKLGFIAKELGITTYSLQRKIDNQTEFKASEIAVFSRIGMSRREINTYFFANIVE